MRLIELRICRWVRFMLESFAACIRHSIVDRRLQGKSVLWWWNSCFQPFASIVTFLPCACMEKTNIHAIMAYYTLATCVAVSLSSCQIFRSQKDRFPKTLIWSSDSVLVILLFLCLFTATQQKNYLSVTSGFPDVNKFQKKTNALFFITMISASAWRPLETPLACVFFDRHLEPFSMGKKWVPS